jgi:endonuclease YncB( thermonuclease family)
MRRFRRFPPWSVWVCAGLACAIAGRYGWERLSSVAPRAALGSSRIGSLAAGEFDVIRVDRADLLLVKQQVSAPQKSASRTIEVPLQLLGVTSHALEGSPELAELGRQFTAEMLSSGVPSLELDRRRLDEDGHFLAYAYVNGKLLNEELVRAGWARAVIYPGDNQTLQRSIIKAEKEARATGRGIWAREGE